MHHAMFASTNQSQSATKAGAKCGVRVKPTLIESFMDNCSRWGVPCDNNIGRPPRRAIGSHHLHREKSQWWSTFKGPKKPWLNWAHESVPFRMKSRNLAPPPPPIQLFHG